MQRGEIRRGAGAGRAFIRDRRPAAYFQNHPIHPGQRSGRVWVQPPAPDGRGVRRALVRAGRLVGLSCGFGVCLFYLAAALMYGWETKMK